MVSKQPKYDIHRHMGGSISPETVWKIIEETGSYHIAQSLPEIRKRMTYSDGDVQTFSAFLDKLSILDNIPWPDWAIDLAVSQICNDIKSEGIDHCDLSFSVDKYVRGGLWRLGDALLFIKDRYRYHTARCGITVKLLLSLAYHSARPNQLKVASIISDKDLGNCVDGLDLVGDEVKFDPSFYWPIIKRWRDAGKITRAHVGELFGTGHHVKMAIDLGVSKIAHGIRGSAQDIELATKHGIVFDLALHSNMYTGVTSNIRNHPLSKMIDIGAMITLNTDDPVQFGCTLADEFELALSTGLATEQQLERIMDNAKLPS